MPTYKTIKIGQFRSTTDNGDLAKTYVYYVKEEHTIGIIRYHFGKEAGGWSPVKQFKDKWLFKETMNFHVSSFQKIGCFVSRFLSWNTKINQQK